LRQISEKLINYTVYKDGSLFLGTADVELPSIEAMTETVKGAGIGGEIESSTLGHYGSMTCTLNWRTVTPEVIRLHAPISHSLDFRGSMQVYNPATGETRGQGVKVTVKAMPKSGSIGKMDPGTTMDTSNEMEVTYIKIVIDGRTLLEIDKYNFKCVIDGRDYLAEVREQLGM